MRLSGTGFSFAIKRYTQRNVRELLNYLKCHSWNHLATECQEAHDTCGMCTQRHFTAECPNLDKLFCVPCGRASHASWDRYCPVFQHKCSDMNVRVEENAMPNFPTPETWTQVKEPPKVIIPAGVNGMEAHDRPARLHRFTQTTLNFYQARGPVEWGGAYIFAARTSKAVEHAVGQRSTATSTPRPCTCLVWLDLCPRD